MFQVAIIFVAERKATAVVAGLARVQRPYSAASRSLATPATDFRLKAVMQTLNPIEFSGAMKTTLISTWPAVDWPMSACRLSGSPVLYPISLRRHQQRAL